MQTSNILKPYKSKDFSTTFFNYQHNIYGWFATRPYRFIYCITTSEKPSRIDSDGKKSTDSVFKPEYQTPKRASRILSDMGLFTKIVAGQPEIVAVMEAAEKELFISSTTNQLLALSYPMFDSEGTLLLSIEPTTQPTEPTTSNHPLLTPLLTTPPPRELVAKLYNQLIKERTKAAKNREYVSKHRNNEYKDFFQ